MNDEPEYSCAVMLDGNAEVLAGVPLASDFEVLDGGESGDVDLLFCFLANRNLSLAWLRMHHNPCKGARNLSFDTIHSSGLSWYPSYSFIVTAPRTNGKNSSLCEGGYFAKKAA